MYLIFMLDFELGKVALLHSPLSSHHNRPCTCRGMFCSLLLVPLVVCAKSPSDLTLCVLFGVASSCNSLGSYRLNGRGSVLIDNTDQDKLGGDWCLQGHSGDQSSWAQQGMPPAALRGPPISKQGLTLAHPGPGLVNHGTSQSTSCSLLFFHPRENCCFKAFLG